MSSVQVRLPLPGPLVKRLRHRPFTAVTWVRFPYGSPNKKSRCLRIGIFLFHEMCGNRKAVKKTCRWHVFRPWEIPLMSGHGLQDCGRTSKTVTTHFFNSRTGHPNPYAGIKACRQTVYEATRFCYLLQLPINSSSAQQWSFPRLARRSKTGPYSGSPRRFSYSVRSRSSCP